MRLNFQRNFRPKRNINLIINISEKQREQVSRKFHSETIFQFFNFLVDFINLHIETFSISVFELEIWFCQGHSYFKLPTFISFRAVIYSLSEKWILSTSVTTSYFYFLRVCGVGCFFEGFFLSLPEFSPELNTYSQSSKSKKLSLNAWLFDGFTQFIYLQLDEKEWDPAVISSIYQPVY